MRAWLGLGRGQQEKRRVNGASLEMESSGGARREAIAGERVSLRVSRLAKRGWTRGNSVARCWAFVCTGR